MTASAFLRSSGLTIGKSSDIIRIESISQYICEKPLRSPMSIFSKSTDLEKCEAGTRE